MDKLFYQQDFQSGPPLTPTRSSGYYTAPRYLQATDPPLATFPELNEVRNVEAIAGIGKDGGYGIWFDPSYIGNIPECDFQIGVMGDGRNPGWGIAGGMTGKAQLSPISTQTSINFFEIDVQFRSEVFVGPIWGDDNPYLDIAIVHNNVFALCVALNQNAVSDWVPETNYWYLQYQLDAAQLEPGGYRITQGSVQSVQWPHSQFDLDGAFHKIRVEWKPCTYSCPSGYPINWSTITVNSDGWIRASMDGVTILEATGIKFKYNLPSPTALAYDSFGYTSSLSLADHGYSHISNVHLHGIGTYHTSGYIESDSLTGEFARDISEVQTGDTDGLGPQDSKWRVKYWTQNPAGSCRFAMNFDLPTSGPQYFFAVRNNDNTPQLEFKRDGTTLIVEDAVGEIGRATSVLVEDAYTTGDSSSHNQYSIFWKFSSYVNGVAQADGYIEVYIDPYPSGADVALLVLRNIVVECHDPTVPYTHLWWCPQGDMRQLDAYEACYPEQIDRYSYIQIATEEYLGFIFDNIKLGIVSDSWVDIPEFIEQELSFSSYVNGVARVSCEAWSDAEEIYLRLYNETLGVSVGESSVIMSAVPVEVEFPVTLSEGVNTYKLQVTSNELNKDIFVSSAVLLP